MSSSADPAPWLSDWLAALAARHGRDIGTVADTLLIHARQIGLRVARQGDKDLGVALVVPGTSWEATPVIVTSDARVGWEIGDLRHHQPFSPPAMEQELRAQLARVKGMDVEKPDWPDVPLFNLLEGEALEAFIEALKWTLEAIQRVSHREVRE